MKVSITDVYLSIASFDQYIDIDLEGNEVYKKTYKLHITFKNGEEWIHPVFKDFRTISKLKKKVEQNGVINLDRWLKLEKWERLNLIKYTPNSQALS